MKTEEKQNEKNQLNTGRKKNIKRDWSVLFESTNIFRKSEILIAFFLFYLFKGSTQQLKSGFESRKFQQTWFLRAFQEKPLLNGLSESMEKTMRSLKMLSKWYRKVPSHQKKKGT